MYNTGWDVLAFDEADLGAPEQIPWMEAVIAHDQRFVELGIIGYSQGGGAAHDLIEKLWFDDFFGNGDPDQIITRIGVYIDAVVYDGSSAETSWPFVAFHLVNFYETIAEPGLDPGGGDVDNTDPDQVGATLEEYDVTSDGAFPPGLDHFTIDDDPLVQELTRLRLLQFLQNR